MTGGDLEFDRVLSLHGIARPPADSPIAADAPILSTSRASVGRRVAAADAPAMYDHRR